MDIHAWFISGSLIYQWQQPDWSPQLKLRSGYSSGNRDQTDGRLNTFRAPDPPGRYFGDTTPFGPGNLTGSSIALNVSPIPKLQVEPSFLFFWRAETDDGLYNPGGRLIREAVGNNRFVSWEASLSVHYLLSANWTLRAEAGHAFAEQYLNNNPPDEEITRWIVGAYFSY